MAFVMWGSTTPSHYFKLRMEIKRVLLSKRKIKTCRGYLLWRVVFPCASFSKERRAVVLRNLVMWRRSGGFGVYSNNGGALKPTWGNWKTVWSPSVHVYTMRSPQNSGNAGLWGPLCVPKCSEWPAQRGCTAGHRWERQHSEHQVFSRHLYPKQRATAICHPFGVNQSYNSTH